ncbi:hypothetical protein F4810DRAFT_696822 [Camillea tinctor]|nr:hypothetical protein F4810DRAFT_696822 [Camillea tinctor]
MDHWISAKCTCHIQNARGFTLTWTNDYLFLTVSHMMLRILRIPLYREIEERETESRESRGICENGGTIFLPKSCQHQDVQFIPTSNSRRQRTSSSYQRLTEANDEVVGMVVLSSGAKGFALKLPLKHWENSRGLPVPPHVFRLTVSQLGSWTGLNRLRICRHGERHPEGNPIKSTYVLRFQEPSVCRGCGGIM